MAHPHATPSHSPATDAHMPISIQPKYKQSYGYQEEFSYMNPRQTRQTPADYKMMSKMYKKQMK